MKKAGIVGLPNSGKSTLFNALTNQNVPNEKYPFCTIDPNIGVMIVPDQRIIKLAQMEGSEQVVHPFFQIVDIAGLVKGASKGEGLGNQFLDHISKVDLIFHVVRCFKIDDVSHPMGSVDPIRDIEIVETELILKDLETIEKRMEKISKQAKSGDEKARHELNLLENLKKHLESGKLAITFPREKQDQPIIDSLFLLTEKPVVYVANVDEWGMENNLHKKVEEVALKNNSGFVLVNAELEYEVEKLSEEEAKEFLQAYGFDVSLKERFFQQIKSSLRLICFLTATKNEARSWLIPEGMNAYDAAGLIHTDIQKGFVKAEVIPFDELIKFSCFKEAKEKGFVKAYGKDYVIKEGDVVHFLFHS
ncbi:redox-regulated ATPase YchF [Pseudothermotoga thermarum]|uniref:Ribosome-binding ATPase YchF n=1 Tax=Pseudothermotoga thermarum DSM 5069 TaxID=688269 RepID=F7YWD8_9THEM|nr:redox-regulated ATPase YchF [Pseudothermotoga thermarum]AEH51916.1 GTP-binding protein YchF [Pseudothermotoga thermarum DSM 5069]